MADLKNKVLWDSTALAAALQIQIPVEVVASGVAIDSRTLKGGEIFIGIKGENFDGSDFIDEALRRGAVLCLSHHPHTDPRVITLPNTIKGLEMLATYNRNRINPRIIAITGSNGKTSTKDMLHLALRELYEVYASWGNFNNHIGLPLNLANMPLSTEIAICEMGMNHRGEIEHLSKLACPDLAIITTVNPTHIGNFTSVSAIAEAKAEIMSGMQEGGAIIINIDHDYKNILLEIARKKRLQIVTYGYADSADIKLLAVEDDLKAQQQRLVVEAFKHIYRYTLGSLSPSLAINTVAIVAVLLNLRAQMAFALKHLEAYHGSHGRGRVIHYRNKLVIDDAYNASFDSMREGLKMLAKFNGYKRVAVLGDMRELGAREVEYHTALLPLILQSGIDKVVTVGQLMQHLHSKLPTAVQGEHFEKVEDVSAEALECIMLQGEVFLIKASHGTGLYRLVSMLEEDVVS